MGWGGGGGGEDFHLQHYRTLEMCNNSALLCTIQNNYPGRLTKSLITGSKLFPEASMHVKQDNR